MNCQCHLQLLNRKKTHLIIITTYLRIFCVNDKQIDYFQQSLPPPTTPPVAPPAQTSPGTLPPTTSATSLYVSRICSPLQNIGGTCVSTFDCPDPLSDCLGGTCVCTAGYTYDCRLQQCIAIFGG